MRSRRCVAGFENARCLAQRFRVAIIPVLLIIALSTFVFGQGEQSPVRRRTVELQIQLSEPGLARPASRIGLILHRIDAERPDTTIFLDDRGAATIVIMPGRYQLTTAAPIRFGGQAYTWDFEIAAFEPVNAIALTRANAATATPEQPQVSAEASATAPASEEDRALTAPSAPPVNSAQRSTLRLSLAPNLGKQVTAGPLAVTLRRMDGDPAPEQHVAVPISGNISVPLRPGRYQLSISPARVGDYMYGWNLEVPVTPGDNPLELTVENAEVYEAGEATLASSRAAGRPAPTNSRKPSVTQKPTAVIPVTPLPEAAAIERPTALTPEQRQVMDLLHRWLSSVKQHDLEELMSCYAPVMTRYFRKYGVTAAEVRRDKAKFLKTYSEIRQLAIRNVEFEHNANGTEVSFHKLWDFAGSRTFSGEVVARLTLAKRNAQWVITAERERLVWRKKSPVSVAAQ